MTTPHCTMTPDVVAQDGILLYRRMVSGKRRLITESWITGTR